MAKIELYTPKLMAFEGGYVNNPNDKGGATKYGVTLATWRQVGYDKDGDGDIDANDIKLLTTKDAEIVLRKYFWDRAKASEIKDQWVAEMIVDWYYNSGSHGLKYPQRLLGLTDDGVFGPKTLAAINNYPNQKELFEKIKQERLNFVQRIVNNNSSQKVFLKGWQNRINSFKYGK